MRVTLDSNVYISAFQFGGLPQRVIQLLLEGVIEAAVSPHIVEETLRTLRQKFSWGQDALIRARDTIVLHAELVTPDLMLDVVTDDPDDNRILECAVAGSSKIIVTGDDDLLRLGQYGEIRIIRVRELLNEVASSAD